MHMPSDHLRTNHQYQGCSARTAGFPVTFITVLAFSPIPIISQHQSGLLATSCLAFVQLSPAQTAAVVELLVHCLSLTRLAGSPAVRDRVTLPLCHQRPCLPPPPPPPPPPALLSLSPSLCDEALRPETK